MIKVGVLGAAGKMGGEVCRAIAEDPETTLVAAVDPAGPGGTVAGVSIGASIDGLAGAQVAVDFTHPDAVMGNLRWLIERGIHAVVGTTGIGDADLQEVRALLEKADGRSNVFVAPNFAIGAVLMTRFAALAARHLPQAEIVELHHDNKADAPSGTAIATARAIAAERRGDPARARESAETVAGARGGTVEGVPIHSVRLRGLVAHQEVILGGPGQTLSIRHDSTDRTSFMPGVLLAVKAVAGRPGLTVGLEQLLDL